MKLLKILCFVMISSNASAFETLDSWSKKNDLGDPHILSYLFKRCGTLNFILSEKFRQRNKADEVDTVSAMSKQSAAFLNMAEKIDQASGYKSQKSDLKEQILLLAKLYREEMDKNWASTGSLLNSEISSDLSLCSTLYKKMEK